MMDSPKSSSTFNGVPIFLIMSGNTVEELSKKVSEALTDGPMFLHGQPLCLRIKSARALNF
jgi:hypothetical protein